MATETGQRGKSGPCVTRPGRALHMGVHHPADHGLLWVEWSRPHSACQRTRLSNLTQPGATASALAPLPGRPRRGRTRQPRGLRRLGGIRGRSSGHFPRQNWAKIRVRRSSVAVCPTIASSASVAPFSSSAIRSKGMPAPIALSPLSRAVRASSRAAT